MNGYQRMKALAARLGHRVTDLLVLHRSNDPFYVGSPAQVAMAEWFTKWWRRFGYDDGAHLRRVHYQLVSQADPRRADGNRYENTDRNWNYLCSAAKYARCLGLVDATAVEDHRNPPPAVYAPPEPPPAPGLEWVDHPPEIPSPAEVDLYLSFPRPRPTGYDYHPAHQAVHVEVWCEKSTMNSVLLPVCAEYSLNLVTSLGFQSLSSAVELLRRIARTGKPCRVFYISDFDPAGDNMPVAVARQLEYWLPTYAPAADIRLTPLCLTREQVRGYQLPRIPIKDTDNRKNGFEQRHGEGAVELDALEALHPGELARLLREAVAPYRDPGLPEALRQAALALRETFEPVLPEFPEARLPAERDDWLFDSRRDYQEQLNEYRRHRESA